MVYINQLKKGPKQSSWIFSYLHRPQKDNSFIYTHSSDGHAIFIYNLHMFNSYKDSQISLDIQTEQNLALID